MSEEPVSDELREVEAALGSLAPMASGIKRDRLMYLAGQASNRRLPRPVGAWLWRTAMSASLLAAAAFGTLWVTAGKPEIVERVVYVEAKRPPVNFDFAPASTAPPSPWENRRLCQLVLEKGVDAMPQLEPPIDGGAAPISPAPVRRDSYRDLFNDLLEESSS